MHDTLVGVDLAKAVFQLAISCRPGRFDSHPRLTREEFLPFFAQLPAAVVIMEACGTCHFWARKDKPGTMVVAFEAAAIDWLPRVRIPSWPGVLGDSNAQRPKIRL
jgi:hypothetical protein